MKKPHQMGLFLINTVSGNPTQMDEHFVRAILGFRQLTRGSAQRRGNVIDPIGGALVASKDFSSLFDNLFQISHDGLLPIFAQKGF